MIIARQKPFEEILEALEKDHTIYLVGCTECATVTQTGGQKEVEEMKARLEAAGKKVVAVNVAHAVCKEPDTKRILRETSEAADEADAFLVLACGSGTQAVREATEKHVVPGTDSLFVGNVRRHMDFDEKCTLCGECILDEFGGVCPVSRCAKGLLNGPCGGTNHGKCEVNPDKDCAWVLVYNRLEKEGRLRNFSKIQPPKRWNAVGRPGHLDRRRRGGDDES